MAFDVYKMIEDKVVDQLKNGIIPWRRCYHTRYGNMCFSHQTGRAYSLLNQFILDEPGEYWTFEQAIHSGYKIKKGAKASKVVFWKVLQYADKSKSVGLDGEQVDYMKQIPFLKYYNVFHENDVEGLPDKMSDEDRERNNESFKPADEIISNYLAANKDIQMIESDRTPCYVPSLKTIYVPAKCQFDSINDYYHACFHEIIHSTKEVLKRPIAASDADRAKEELVAEIGGACLCGHCGISSDEVVKNSSAYCAGWLQALSGNIKWLIWASSRADSASRYVINGEVSEVKESEN